MTAEEYDQFKNLFTHSSLNYQQGGTGRGKSAAVADYMKMMNEEYEKAYEFASKGRPSEPDPSPVYSIGGGWSAPIGWNNYLTKGNFVGWRPIIRPSAKINNTIFESLKFEMA